MPETRQAIHAISAENVPWQPCSDILNYSIPFPISLIDLHKDLVSEGRQCCFCRQQRVQAIRAATATCNAPVSCCPVPQRPFAMLCAGLRALLYSGDHDFVVPFTGTRAWIYSMQLPVERPYAAWTIEGQVQRRV